MRSMVKEEISNSEKVTDARLRSLDDKIGALEVRVDARIDSLEEKFTAKMDSLEGKFEARFQTLDKKIESLVERIPVIQDLADIKARLTALEKNRNWSFRRGLIL